MKVRRYSELRRLKTFEERFDYLMLRGEVGRTTFGFDRWINQHFYQSLEWKQARDYVIYRDNGCDLGVPGYEIHVDLLVHHINPVSPDDLKRGETWVLDPQFLITTTHRTHNAIHYANRSMLPQIVIERQPGDTRLW